MTREHDVGSAVAALILAGRQTAGLSQAQLAKIASVSRSRIIAAEGQVSVPTLDVCLCCRRQ